MKKALFAAISLLFILSSCSKEEKLDKLPEIVEVEIQIPDTINVDNEVTLKALVTQGKEKVEDATEVNFEIAKLGQETGEKIIGKHQGQGIYSITKTFKETCGYSLTVHVTARDMHTMPKKEFRVE